MPSYYVGTNVGSSGGGGEQAQTFIVDRQRSSHRLSSMGHNSNKASTSTNTMSSTQSNGSLTNQQQQPLLLRTSSSFDRRYGAMSGLSSPPGGGDLNTIRFQVVVWNIGKLDVITSSVPMTFRVTMFWNDVLDATEAENSSKGDSLVAGGDDNVSMTSSTGPINVWRMHGRQKAFQQELKDLPQTVEVPPLAIMNCSTFEIIGSPEIDMLREGSRLMRWTCMYRAVLIQENLRVHKFPHDDHDIYIKLAILSHRGKGKQWDRRIWKLALATKDDSQQSTKIPHGLIVQQAQLPGFHYNKERGLAFNFSRLDHGALEDNSTEDSSHDEYLKVSLKVLRQSGYYDKNIVPLLALMNVVAVSVLTFKDTEFFYRALITLNIAFVEMSIRMTADSHLPSVGYEIRLQRILNEFFFVLMCLVLEAMFVNVLVTSYNVSTKVTRTIDWATGVLAVCHNILILARYYRSKRRAQWRLDHGWKEGATKKAV